MIIGAINHYAFLSVLYWNFLYIYIKEVFVLSVEISSNIKISQQVALIFSRRRYQTGQ